MRFLLKSSCYVFSRVPFQFSVLIISVLSPLSNVMDTTFAFIFLADIETSVTFKLNFVI